jgi:CheY-like chemotaxis protein
MKSEPYVLVVDDERDIRELVQDILQFEGYSVVTASNGREALEHLRRAALPGLILLDLMMPIMNGWEFRAEQLEDPQLRSIPVVVLTGNRYAPERARELNVSSYITKPIHLDQLLALVRGAAVAR